MSGNQDRAARAAALVGEVYDLMEAKLRECAAAVAATTIDKDNAAGAAVCARRVGVIVRSTQALARLAGSPPRTGRRPAQEEDEMEHRDDSPETLERLRAELAARLDRLRSVLETKGMGVEPGCWPTARAAGEPVRPA